ncbi:MAG: transglycosylase SLT domain-containing protein, partial [Chitinispirillaceae bacterium]
RERSVSGHHAILYLSGENIRIQDLQSTNGLYLDEKRIAESDLHEGAVVGFGKKGPRLSVIISDHEMNTGVQSLSGEFAGSRNHASPYADGDQFAQKDHQVSSAASFSPDDDVSFKDDIPLSNASFQNNSGCGNDSPLNEGQFTGGSSLVDDAPLSNASFQNPHPAGSDTPLSNASFQNPRPAGSDTPLSNSSIQGDSSCEGEPLSNASFQNKSSSDYDAPLSNASFQNNSACLKGNETSGESFGKGAFFDGAHDYKMAKEFSSDPHSSKDDDSFSHYRSAGVGDIKIIDDESGLSGDMAPPSSTMAVEQKFIEKNIDAEDIHELMKNDGRLNRLVERGNLGRTQANMLVSVQNANKKMRSQWQIILSSVIGIAMVVIAFFAVRAFQYKRMVDKGLSLEQKLDSYEKQIAKANNYPDANQDKLSKLLEEFEKTQNELKEVKTELNEDDYEKFYDDPLEEKIDQIMQRFGESNYHIPPQMVERVRYHIEIYSGRMKRTIGRYLKRKEKYFPMIESVFKRKNLPIELAYVSMLESGFNPKALSHAGARGLWQFMPHTGRAYGLRVTDEFDDRLNPEKATYAAAEYFRDLIAIFGGRRSVMLAMAAYNAGEGRVMGALKKIDDPMRDRDFWYIYRMGYLAEETNEYIPRIIALMIIDENASEFGFNTSTYIASSELEDHRDFIEVDFGDYSN